MHVAGEYMTYCHTLQHTATHSDVLLLSASYVAGESMAIVTSAYNVVAEITETSHI